MSQSDPETDLRGVGSEAAEWAVRLQLRELSAEEQAELNRWLEADERRQGALLRARAAWVDLDRLAALAGPDVAQATPRFNKRRRGLIAAGLAAFVFSLVVGTWWLLRPHSEVYVSAVGEVRSVTLSDGSGMVLNTATEATVRFDPGRREIELRDGEGLFQVAKDPRRPFIVRSGHVSVRAVGTVFAVRARDGRVEVTVTEGVVEVVDAVAAVTMAANERAVVREAGRLEVLSMPLHEADRRLAWREGMLDFAGESLASAVMEINRHNTKHIVVDGATLQSRPVVGLFRASDPDGFAQTIAAALALQSVDRDGVIHLRERPAR